MEVAAALDRIKDAGFHWATRSGVTVALSDILTPPNKREIISGYEKQAAKVQDQFDKGLTTEARASPGAHRDLEPRHRRGCEGDGRQPSRVEQHQPHGLVRSPW